MNTNRIDERSFHAGVWLGIIVFALGLLAGWWLQGRFEKRTPGLAASS